MKRRMREIILRMIGLGPETVQGLQKNIHNLELTVGNLTIRATEAYNKSEQAVILYNKLGIDKEDDRWWEKDSGFFKDTETRALANDIKKAGMKDFVRSNPSLKERFIFHGACLGCATPINKECGVCLGCKYSGWGSSLPNLSSKNN